MYPCPHAIYLGAGEVDFFKHMEAVPEEECVEAKGAQIPKTACILQGSVLNFPLGSRVRFQHLFFPFPQLLSWATASLKTHHSSALYLGGPLGSRGLE